MAYQIYKDQFGDYRIGHCTKDKEILSLSHWNYLKARQPNHELFKRRFESDEYVEFSEGCFILTTTGEIKPIETEGFYL